MIEMTLTSLIHWSVITAQINGSFSTSNVKKFVIAKSGVSKF